MISYMEWSVSRPPFPGIALARCCPDRTTPLGIQWCEEHRCVCRTVYGDRCSRRATNGDECGQHFSKHLRAITGVCE